MSELLMGKEVSGTPVETRKGTVEFAGLLQNLMKGQGGGQVKGMTSPFMNLTTDAMMSLFGDLNSAGVAKSLLADPRDTTRGLFASMVPFEREATDRAVADTRAMFGTMGGRFGKNVALGEAKVRSGLEAEFGRNRENALLAANEQRGNVLFNLLNAAQRSAELSTLPFQLAAGFLRPGEAQFQEGILPGLLSTGISLYGMSQLGKRPGMNPNAPTYLPQPRGGIPQGSIYRGWGNS